MSCNTKPIDTYTRLERWKRIDPETGCWLWTGHRNIVSGHGYIRFKGSPRPVHRVAMHIYKDFDLASPGVICHIRTCPNAHCFNPEHLYVGTKGTNAMDAIATGKLKPWRK